MNDTIVTMERKIADAVTVFQTQSTGHAPTSVSVVLGDETLVITLHDAASPAEKMLAAQPVGAAQLQQYHRQLFLNSSSSLRNEIKRITGRDIRESAVEIDANTGAVVHAFTTGTMVQVFLFAEQIAKKTASDAASSPQR